MLTSDGDFLEALYDEGIGGHFDGLSLRPFNYGRDPYDESVPSEGRKYSYALGVPLVREIMQAHGDGSKRMWFTELGWSSCAPGHQQLVRDRGDAGALHRGLAAARARPVGLRRGDQHLQPAQQGRRTRPTARRRWACCTATSRPSRPSGRSGDAIAELRATPAVTAGGQTRVAEPAHGDHPAPAGPGGAQDHLAVGNRPTGLAPAVGALRAVRARTGDAVGCSGLSARRRCSRRCLRWVAVRRSTRRAGTAGANRMGLGITALRPGRYRLAAHATDAAANRSATARDGFRVAPGP